MSDHLKQNKVVPLDKLTPHPRNYRGHPEGQVSKLVASLARFGQGRSIVCQDGPEGYLIVAGHGIVEAAKKLKYTELRADILPADWSPEQVEGYLVADNLHSQDAEDDETMLAAILQEQQDAGFDLASLGTDDETLRQLLEGLGDEYLGGGDDERDEAEDELPEEVETRAKVGDVWQLGRHRIACINSCDVEQVKRLFTDAIPHMIWADPPYGIKVVKNNMVGAVFSLSVAKKGKYEPVVGDETTATAIAAYRLCTEYWASAVHIWWGANNYTNALPPSNCWVIWDKRADSGIENTFADCEMAWTNMTSPTRVYRQLWNGMIRSGEHEKRVHPTQKPVALAEWAFEKYGNDGDVIYDPFLGSGMSVIAAENLHRTVYGCELSPEYIDVIITRWEKLTGQTATLLERVEEAAHVS